MMSAFYTTYSDYLARIFPGRKVQKITVDAGMTCPNRDGAKGRGGCIYCCNASFSPATGAESGSLADKIRRGKEFFRRKYKDMTYLVYFQSYTPTYGPLPDLLDMFCSAMEGDDVEGIVIGTRPDCMPDALVDALARLNASKPVLMEFGAESFRDATLADINRGHTSADIVDAVQRCSAAGLSCGLHLIMGLPGETRTDMLENVRRAVSLPIDVLKIHQMQVIRNTVLAHRVASGKGAQPTLFGLEEYLELCRVIVGIVPRSVAIDRFVSQAPADLLLAPRWGVKNHEFTAMLEKRMKKNYDCVRQNGMPNRCKD